MLFTLSLNAQMCCYQIVRFYRGTKQVDASFEKGVHCWLYFLSPLLSLFFVRGIFFYFVYWFMYFVSVWVFVLNAGSSLWHTCFSSYSGWASLLMVGRLTCPTACENLVSQTRIKSESPALEGGFLTTEPPRKSLLISPNSHCFWFLWTVTLVSRQNVQDVSAFLCFSISYSFNKCLLGYLICSSKHWGYRNELR